MSTCPEAGKIDEVPSSKNPEVVAFLREKAEKISSDPESSIHNMTQALARDGISFKRILAHEFVSAFEAAEIPNLLVDKFINEVVKNEVVKNEPEYPSSNEEDESLQQAHAKLKAFIATYPDLQYSTISETLRTIAATHQVSMRALLNEEMRDAMISSVKVAAEKIAYAYFKGFYEEKKQHEKVAGENSFWNHVLPRVIDVTTFPLQVNSNNLAKLVEFLGEIGELDDNVLYLQVHEWLFKNCPVLKIEKDVQKETTETLAEKNSQPENPSFNFGDFFERYFAPHIVAYRKKNLVRPVEIDAALSIARTTQTRVFMPADVFVPLYRLAGLKEEWMQEFLSRIFNKGPDTLMTNLELSNELRQNIEVASGGLQGIVAKSVRARSPEDPIRKDYQLIPEIFASQDLQTLIRAAAYPEHFLKNLSATSQTQLVQKYGARLKEVVRYESMLLLMDTLAVRSYAFSPEYTEREERADSAETTLLSSFGVKIPKEKIPRGPMTFFIGKNKKTGRWEKRMVANLDRNNTPPELLDPHRKDIYEDENYVWFPAETKRFGGVTAEILDPLRFNKLHSIPIIFYLGEHNRFVDFKTDDSFFSAYKRESDHQGDYDGSDTARCAIGIPNDPDDSKRRIVTRSLAYNFSLAQAQVMKDPFRRIYAKNGHNIDFEHISRYEADAGVYVLAGYGNCSEQRGGNLVRRKVKLEIQVFPWEELLIKWLSHFSPYSHYNYVTAREFGSAQKIFIPAIYGERFLEHLRGGYKKQGNLIEL